jgi:hypothetical protein
MIYKNYLINNNINSINLSILTKNIYTNKEFWQLNLANYQSLAQLYLNKTKDNIDNYLSINIKNFKLNNIKNLNLFYQLSNYHSFLISNLTIIILLFVLKPSILLSSARLLSLSIFTY